MKHYHARDLFNDIQTGEAARDEAIERVDEHNKHWRESVLALIERLPHGWTGIGEDIRLLALEEKLGKPHHHNAWGGVIMGAVKRKLLVDTGERRKMRVTASHARQSPIYRKI